MKKHFLVTISNDVDHLYGVQFICSFFKEMSEHHLTLLHICRLDDSTMSKALNEMWTDPDKKIQSNLSLGARRSLDKALALLDKSRMSIDQVITKTVAERFGKVKDILTEGSEGLYDAVILGQRASYTLQWAFERPGDEMAQIMIKDSCCNTPLWICPDPGKGRKNVLLCIDGSENAYRAADHVGYILSAQDQHTVTLFHVVNSISEASDKFFQQAESILHEHGIGSERINRKTGFGLTVTGSILSEIDKGGYAAVAVGLHGLEHGVMKEFNMVGGTTSKLIYKLEKTALWCCP